MLANSVLGEDLSLEGGWLLGEFSRGFCILLCVGAVTSVVSDSL